MKGELAPFELNLGISRLTNRQTSTESGMSALIDKSAYIHLKFEPSRSETGNCPI